jgi:hypothetical protein
MMGMQPLSALPPAVCLTVGAPRLIFVSSEKKTRFQSSTVQWRYFFADANLAFRCLAVSSGLWTLEIAHKPLHFRERATVFLCTSTPRSFLSACWTAVAVETLPVETIRAIAVSSRAESLRGRPARFGGMFSASVALQRATIDLLTPSWSATTRVERPARKSEMARVIVSRGRRFMVE